VVEKALEKDPARRFGSAAEMLAALRAAGGAAARLSRARRRSRRLGTAVVVVLAGLIGLAVVVPRFLNGDRVGIKGVV
jgi:hypothetical protein